MARHRQLSREARLRRTVLTLAVVVVAGLGVGVGFIVDHHVSSPTARSESSNTDAVTTLLAPSTTATPPASAPAGTSVTVTSPPVSVSLPATSGPATTAGPPVTTVAPPSPTSPTSVLTGKVVAIDPGHNGDNFADPSVVNHLIWNGREYETCDTTGTETDAGYTEAAFNFAVALDLRGDLEAEGAKVVLTRTTNSGVGPCVTERAAIGNAAHANAAISIHADGGPATGRGFTVLEPVADGPNDAIIGQSLTLGSDIRAAMLSGAVEQVSDYYGTDGLQPRDDLGGLNLSTVPKVLIECANMRNASDAVLITSVAWQQQVARALAAGITSYLQATPAA